MGVAEDERMVLEMTHKVTITMDIDGVSGVVTNLKLKQVGEDLVIIEAEHKEPNSMYDVGEKIGRFVVDHVFE